MNNTNIHKNLLERNGENRYAFNIIEYVTPTKENLIRFMKTRDFGKITFRVPVKYAGVYIDTAEIEIERGFKNHKPTNRTSDIKVSINHKELKGLRNAKKALKNIEEAKDIEMYNIVIVK